MVSSQVSVWPTNASYSVPWSSAVPRSAGHSRALWRSSEATRNGHLLTPCLKHHSLNMQPVALPADALNFELGCCDGVQGEKWFPWNPAAAQGRLYWENDNQQHTAGQLLDHQEELAHALLCQSMNKLKRVSHLWEESQENQLQLPSLDMLCFCFLKPDGLPAPGPSSLAENERGQKKYWSNWDLSTVSKAVFGCVEVCSILA